MVAGLSPDEVDFSMALRSTQSLTVKSTRNLTRGHRPAGPWGSQPYRHLIGDYLENVGDSTSHKPVSLHSIFRDCFIFYLKVREYFSYQYRRVEKIIASFLLNIAQDPLCEIY
jgi:hypothetical protein